ncbi:MAG TPA: phosphoribosylaminoimidazolesuccinocarboxamide synthase [Candidatus Staskawiczbacteria bacterium]|nr:phosphoribosylaminoimidazolesuccinocarboxamide synthase [Candidatus Staskawiczbacteria bacterium]
MATLSPARADWPLLEGLNLLSRGKVRDTYELSERTLLSVATDGLSIFDFVLNTLVPRKGVVLNCMNHFWSEYLEQFNIQTHLLAAGARIDEYLPSHLQNNPDLQSRAIVVQKMQMAPVEFIYRSVLTGSVVSGYKKDGAVCDHQLPPGLQDGDALPYVMDTPTTKAEEGHDENMSFREVRRAYPMQTLMGLQIFQICASYAQSRGIKLADTKFEFGQDSFGELIGDEIVTPDSSRFWDFDEWQNGRKEETRKAPSPYDKQLVRAWGMELGINKHDPKKPEDVAWVHSLKVPNVIISRTSTTYQRIFGRLTGCQIQEYLHEKMGLPR